MASERFWTGIGTLQFVSNGGLEGQVQVLSTQNIKVKQKVLVKSNTQNSLTLEVKSVLNSTDLILGPINPTMRGSGSYVDLTSYLSTDSASITIEDQSRPNIYMNDWSRSVFEEEPTTAIRTFPVDYLGNRYSTANPFPVAGELTISDSEVVSPKIINVELADPGQIYPIVIGPQVRRYEIKSRNHKGPIKIFQSNDPESAYYTLHKGCSQLSLNIKTLGITLYVQSSQADTIIELYCWEAMSI